MKLSPTCTTLVVWLITVFGPIGGSPMNDAKLLGGAHLATDAVNGVKADAEVGIHAKDMKSSSMLVDKVQHNESPVISDFRSVPEDKPSTGASSSGTKPPHDYSGGQQPSTEPPTSSTHPEGSVSDRHGENFPTHDDPASPAPHPGGAPQPAHEVPLSADLQPNHGPKPFNQYLSDWKQSKEGNLEALLREHGVKDSSRSGKGVVTPLHQEIEKLAVEATQYETKALEAKRSDDVEEALKNMQLAKEKWNAHYLKQEELIKKGGGQYDLKDRLEYIRARQQYLESKQSLEAKDHKEYSKLISDQERKTGQVLQGLKDAEVHRGNLNRQIIDAFEKNSKGKNLKPNSSPSQSKLIKVATQALEKEKQAVRSLRQGDTTGAMKALKQARKLRETYLKNSLKYVESGKGRVDVFEDAKYQKHLAELNQLKDRRPTMLSGPDADKLLHAESDFGSSGMVLPILFPKGAGSPEASVAAWNRLPWNEKYDSIRVLLIRGKHPSVLEEKLARDAIFERFIQMRTHPEQYSRQDWFNIQSVSRDLKVLEDKRAKELRLLHAGIGGKILHTIGHIFWPLKASWKLIRAISRRLGHALVKWTDPNSLTPEARLMLYDKSREVTWLGKGARALGGNPAGWIGRKQPQGNAGASFKKFYDTILFRKPKSGGHSGPL